MKCIYSAPKLSAVALNNESILLNDSRTLKIDFSEEEITNPGDIVTRPKRDEIWSDTEE